MDSCLLYVSLRTKSGSPPSEEQAPLVKEAGSAIQQIVESNGGELIGEAEDWFVATFKGGLPESRLRRLINAANEAPEAATDQWPDAVVQVVIGVQQPDETADAARKRLSGLAEDGAVGLDETLQQILETTS